MSDVVTEGTKKVLSVGCELFQIFQLSDDESTHALKILGLSDIPENAKVIDVGCGVGAVAKIWHTIRPDINFVLVNNNKFQLSLCPDCFEKLLCDAHEIPNEVGPVDAILVHYTMGYLDLDRAFENYAAILKYGGELQVYDMFGNHVYMKQLLGYNTYDPEYVVDKAREYGMELVSQIEFNGLSRANFQKVLSLETDEVAHLCNLALLRMKPVFWRFKKVSQSF